MAAFEKRASEPVILERESIRNEPLAREVSHPSGLRAGRATVDPIMTHGFRDPFSARNARIRSRLRASEGSFDRPPPLVIQAGGPRRPAHATDFG